MKGFLRLLNDIITVIYNMFILNSHSHMMICSVLLLLLVILLVVVVNCLIIIIQN